MSATGVSADTTRDSAIDGLRGLAALLVVIYHLNFNIAALVADVLPGPVKVLLADLGSAGVNIFFVLSGYVIAMTLWRAPLGVGFIGRFALRRSLRLDPPYWATIALVLVADAMRRRLFPGMGDPTPHSWQDVLIHLVYLQDLVGIAPISAVFWTLCLEVQFYLVLVTGMTLAARVAPGRIGVLLAGVLLLSLVSAAIIGGWLQGVPKGLFLRAWHCFALGVLASAVVHRGVHPAWLAAGIALELLMLRWAHDGSAVLPLLTASLLVLARTRTHWTAWLRSRPWQFLGRQSYSLYLVHPTVGWSTISVLKVLAGPGAGPLTGLAFFIAGLVVSIVGAELMRWAVERPAIAWSRRVRLQRA